LHNEKLFIFPHNPSIASALPGKTRKHGNSIYSVTSLQDFNYSRCLISSTF